MKIKVVSVTQSRNITPVYTRVFDPNWIWTAPDGVVFSIVDDSIFPKPEERSRHWDCDHEECDCEGWDEIYYVVPGTEIEIKPPTIQKHKFITGKTEVFGEVEITNFTFKELEDLWNIPRTFSSSDPEIEIDTTLPFEILDFEIFSISRIEKDYDKSFATGNFIARSIKRK